MQKKLTIGLVDVFADSPLSGNPLAIVEKWEGLSDATLQDIAREFNQSETTFLSRSGTADADWDLRSFTADGSEVFGAGHNALGAWLWLAERGALGDLAAGKQFRQRIGGHILPVHISAPGGRVAATMEQAQTDFGPLHDDLEGLAAALGLEREDIMPDPAPRVVSTGAGHLLVRLRDAGTVDRAMPTAAALLASLGASYNRGCYIYALSPDKDGLAYARFFNPSVGMSEDPATGSAAGPLAAYLLKQGILRLGGNLVIEQGTKMGRRSLLRVEANDPVRLTGSGVVVMTGELSLPARPERA